MVWIAFVLILVVAGMGFYVWRHQKKEKAQGAEAQKPFKPYGQDELRIENVGPGAVIHLTGVGENMDDFDLKVISKHTYRQGECNWYELECDRGSEKVWIDMEEDDQLELVISLRELKLRDLNLTKQDLMRFDDDEDGSFKFEGHKYWLEDSDRAVFYRHSNDKEAEKLYYWDFEVERGGKYIGVEKWSDGSYDVTYGEDLKPSQVTVYSLRGD